MSQACAEASTFNSLDREQQPRGDVLLPRGLRAGTPGLGEPGRDLAVVAVLLGLMGVPDRQDAGDQRQHEEDADTGQGAAQPAA